VNREGRRVEELVVVVTTRGDYFQEDYRRVKVKIDNTTRETSCLLLRGARRMEMIQTETLSQEIVFK
jgi:hypothetical protein